MNHKLKIAIYSGVIPSSTFIERLITGLSISNQCEIYLFGAEQQKLPYNNNVKIVGYRNSKLSKFIQLVKYSILLFFFKGKDKKKLDAILKSKNRKTRLDKVKFYPVLWCQPDIFHLQWAKGIEDWIWLQEFGVKVVLSLRGTQINHSPIADKALAAMYRREFPKVDAFHAVSKAMALEAQKYGAKDSKIKVIYSGFEIEPATPIKNKEDVFKIISVGRPHWIKGYTYALDACKLLKDSGFKFQYTIVGAHGNIELAYQIKDLGLQNEVALLGKQPFNDVKEIMQSSDLLVLPSLNEGIANVVLEAMYLKTLVLTTDCGGMLEVIDDGVNGFVVPIRDAKNLAKKILEISTLSTNQIEKICTCALHTVKKQHNEKQMISGMLQFYQDL
ncbi:glycosyltransferase family 4 protein [Winogradskyella eckloniae]|uniref:glycosyltransferase family 4 protein n=1 Tax=Winogradskyella eckloniae TaxID=1089306 RepID=UPI0015672108|nr:glycosyltransferase family 4 protein [Winogradskyella eckloniae]NRD20548.1 glycosyltransferase family 4 protein [Winogradskyella eckloniae]